jgi:hypothetical protein
MFRLSFIFLLFPTLCLGSQYSFNYHHYNDISSFAQSFSLPMNTKGNLFYGFNAYQDASKNTTLLKDEESSMVNFDIGFKMYDYLRFTVNEIYRNNKIKTEELSSGVAKNKVFAEMKYTPREWLELSPYFLLLSDSYKRTTQEKLIIENPGKGEGIKGKARIKDLGSIESEIGFLNQSISKEKKGILYANFERDISRVRTGGNFEGKNIVTQYPIENGEEEKFLEGARGNLYTEFSILKKLNTFISYTGNFNNEIYTLLSGFGGKHNNEKKIYNTLSTNLNLPITSRFLFDVGIDLYRGEKTYQDNLNNEESSMRTLSPSFAYRPNKDSEIRIKRVLRLSSFSFPNPLTVTDRDILDKSVTVSSLYNLPKGTDFSLSFGRTENYIIYLKSEMSANNVKRTKYHFDSRIHYFLPTLIRVEESFSIVANYQIYDYSSNNNLFTRSFSHKTHVTVMNLNIFQPTIEYKIVKQDWGPYLYSYESDNYIFYRNIENKKETYVVTLEVKPFSDITLTPTYSLIRNKFKNLSSEKLNSELIEENYTLACGYKKINGTLIDFNITWVKRNLGNDFYEINSKISYGI